MMSAAEAKTLGTIAQQVRGLLTGIDRLPEAFAEVEGLEVRVAVARKEHARVEADITALKTAYTTLDGDYQMLQASYRQLDAKHREEKARLDATLTAVLAKVAAAQQLKHDTEEQLATITAKWHLKTGHAAAQ